MNHKNMSKEQRIFAAEQNFERRMNGTTIKEHPKSLKYHKRYEQLGNGKKRNRKV